MRKKTLQFGCEYKIIRGKIFLLEGKRKLKRKAGKQTNLYLNQISIKTLL